MSFISIYIYIYIYICMGFTKGTQLNCHVVKLNLFYTSSYAHAHTLDLVWNGFDAFTFYIYRYIGKKAKASHLCKADHAKMKI